MQEKLTGYDKICFSSLNYFNKPDNSDDPSDPYNNFEIITSIIEDIISFMGLNMT